MEKKILTPVKIGPVEVKNRVMFPSMCTFFCDSEGFVSEDQLDVYKRQVHDRPHFHVSLVMDVSPYCDCHGENDIPLIPDVGFFASFDPVALDQACADACNKMPPMPGSVIEGCDPAHDRFSSAFPATNWEVGLEHAQELGIGTRDYELIQVK